MRSCSGVKVVATDAVAVALLLLIGCAVFRAGEVSNRFHKLCVVIRICEVQLFLTEKLRQSS